MVGPTNSQMPQSVHWTSGVPENSGETATLASLTVRNFLPSSVLSSPRYGSREMDSSYTSMETESVAALVSTSYPQYSQSFPTTEKFRTLFSPFVSLTVNVWDAELVSASSVTAPDIFHT